jgi:AcrR family transcriptional regulator
LLVQAAVDLLLLNGTEGLNASRIAEKAGIAQPNFYVYFENLEDCQRAAAERIAHRVHRFITSHRADSFPATMDSVDLDLAIKHYEAILRLPAEDGAYTAAFLKLRGDDSVIGVVMRNLIDQMRTELAADLWRLAEQHGVDKKERPQIDLIAEINLASVFATSSALREGRAKSVPKAARALAVSTIGAVRAVMLDLGATKARSGRR